MRENSLPVKRIDSGIRLVAAVAGFVLLSSPALAIRWDFTSSVEEWTGRNSDVRHSNDGDGPLYMDTLGNDPGMVSPALSVSAASNPLLRMYVWTYCSNLNAVVYFKRSGSSTVYEGGSLFLANGNSGGEYELNLSGNANGTGTITQFRIDPSDSCGSAADPGFVAFDWLEVVPLPTLPAPNLVNPQNGASFTMGQSVTFEWNSVTGGNRYRVKPYTDASFTTCPLGGPFEQPVGQFYYNRSGVTEETGYRQVSAIGTDSRRPGQSLLRPKSGSGASHITPLGQQRAEIGIVPDRGVAPPTSPSFRAPWLVRCS